MRAFLLGAVAVIAAHVIIGYCNRTTAAPRTGAQDGGQWVDLAPLQEPRQEVAVASLDGWLYVTAGFRGDGGTVSTAEAFDPASDRWVFATPLPIAVNHAAAATVGDTLYVIGGHPASGAEAVNNVWAYTASTNAWTPRAPMPTARGSMAVAVADGKIYVMGGSPDPRENDFAVYDPATDAWTVLPPMPTPRNHLAAGSLNGKVYAVGGRSGSIGGISGVLEEYDPATNAWTPRVAMPTPRGGIAAAAANGRLYVFGGEGNRNHPQGIFDQVEAYDPSTDTWQSLPPMAVPRHGIGAAVIGSRIHIPGGATVEGFGVTPVHQALQLDQ